jgi:hypothetical protein
MAMPAKMMVRMASSTEIPAMSCQNVTVVHWDWSRAPTSAFLHVLALASVEAQTMPDAMAQTMPMPSQTLDT